LEKDLSSSPKEISQRFSTKTALEKLNGDINVKLTEEKMTIRTLENNLTHKEKKTIRHIIEEIHIWKNRAKQFKKEISQLISEKTKFEYFIFDICDNFSKEKISSTLENKHTQKEKDIVQHKEKIDMLKNGANKFERDFCSMQIENSQLLSEKTALEKLKGVFHVKLTEEKMTINTLENNFTEKEKETIRHIEEIHLWKNRAKQLKNDLSSSREYILQLLSEKTTREKVVNCDVPAKFTTEETRISTLENNLTQRENEIVKHI